MNTYVIPLSDPHADLATVGGKGLSLAKMISAGFPVPDGFHVTTEAYRQFVAVSELQSKILTVLKDADSSLPASLETASATIGGFFANAAIPAEIAKAIQDAYLALDTSHLAPVAVRSSATAEDLPEASFAGKQDTFLNVRGEDALLEAVKKCWASLWTGRAIAYRTFGPVVKVPSGVPNSTGASWFTLALTTSAMPSGGPSGEPMSAATSAST